MDQKYLLVELLSDINSVIKSPLKSTQRIKFTCFDVSQSYIVFGTTSGGLYIFNRHPHTFVKLIPSKHGSVTQIAISPNEKSLILATVKGFLVAIENCFIENNVNYRVYTEHQGNLVTAIKWHLDDVYCGDNKGKVSVLSLPNLLTKAMFQRPCSSLMKLDSAVIQIDSFSKFLLISTYTRTYICDTEKEQFRQIGKKLRDGYFGACFFAMDNNEMPTTTSPNTKGLSLFKNIDDEQIISNADDVKLFCARPGGRIWEAKLDSSVACTHQFKNAVKDTPTEVVRYESDANATLKVFNENAKSEGINFSKLFILTQKFIFTFNKESFYIFNLEVVTLVCWCNSFKNIKDVKIFNNCIYVWKENSELHVFALYNLEKFILKALFNRQYLLCSELCVKYSEDILKLVPTSKKIHLILALKDKLDELNMKDSLDKLQPLFDALKEFSEQKYANSTGIVIVNKPYDDDVFNETRTEKDGQTLEEISASVRIHTKKLKDSLLALETTVKNLTLSSEEISCVEETEDLEPKKGSSRGSPEPKKGSSRGSPEPKKGSSKGSPEPKKGSSRGSPEPKKYDQISEGSSESKKSESSLEPKVVEKTSGVTLERSSVLKIFEQQFELSKIHCNIEMPKFRDILASSNFENVYNFFKDFELAKQQEDIMSWCYKNVLKQLHKRDFKNEIEQLSMDDPILTYIMSGFCSINHSNQVCSCSFPLPSARIKPPQFYEIGCCLLTKFRKTEYDLFKSMHEEVPYLWKYVIDTWERETDISVLLPLLIQFSDEDLLVTFLNKFKYDTWDNAVQLLIKLKNKRCVNCDNNFEMSCDTLSWTNLATRMMQSIGGPSAIKLLARHAEHIPSSELTAEFYQSCIFATTVDNHHENLRSQAVNFTKAIQEDEATSLQFDKMVARFLQSKYLKKPTRYSKNIIMNGDATERNCSYCNLPLDVPVLSGSIKLKCDHLFHVICFKYNQNICMKCEN